MLIRLAPARYLSAAEHIYVFCTPGSIAPWVAVDSFKLDAASLRAVDAVLAPVPNTVNLGTTSDGGTASTGTGHGNTAASGAAKIFKFMVYSMQILFCILCYLISGFHLHSTLVTITGSEITAQETNKSAHVAEHRAGLAAYR